MSESIRLENYLDFIISTKPALAPVGVTVLAIAEAGRLIRRILARGPLAGALSALVGESRDGDGQKALDVMTNDLLRDALLASPVAAFASEESDEVEILDLHAKLAVALDPLDGSTNIDTLAPLGTIFSILPGRRAGGFVFADRKAPAGGGVSDLWAADRAGDHAGRGNADFYTGPRERRLYRDARRYKNSAGDA